MPKKSKFDDYMQKARKYFSELEEEQAKRHKERAEFIESIQGLEPISKAGAWLGYVANDIRDYGDQEALIYLASKGNDYATVVQKLLNKWRDSEKRSIDMHFSSSRTVIDSKTGKSRTKKSKISPELYKLLKDTQPDFWYGRDYQEHSIDSTMLRTVEWCNIGGFEEYWERNAVNQYTSIVSNGVDPIPASYYLFSMCRSEYGVKLNNKSLRFMLDAIEIPDEIGKVPWLRRLWRIDPPRLVEHFAYAASLVFADGIIRRSDSNEILVERALNSLLKNQERNGAWKCWATNDFVSIETTSMAIHALALRKPRGWEHAALKAKEWLLSTQDRSGYWYDEGSPDVVFLTVLVLDAIELASGGTETTLKSFPNQKTAKTQKVGDKDKTANRQKQSNYYEVIMGDKFVGGNNNSGVQYVGKFHDVITNLKGSGRSDVADALLATQEAIMNSNQLSDEQKKEQIEVLNTIGNEISKPQPNKTLLKMLSDGLLSTLKVVPDVLKIAATLVPYLSELSK
jgi:hypothetical protein